MSKERFLSRWGFILAAIGMAVGTGNVWRFPRVAGEYGGAFLIAWIVALFLWSVPLLMTEMVIGRKTRQGTIGAFRDFMGKKYTWIGAWLGLCAMGILFYYSVVAGWTIKYFTLAAGGAFTPGADTEAIWANFTSSPSQTVLFHAIAIVIAGLVVYQGINKGIERWVKVMVPTLFVCLIIIAIRAMTLPGAWQGVEYLYTINWPDFLEAKMWLSAFTQSAWSTGAGWVMLLTYAIYTKKDDDIGLNVLVSTFGNNSASLIAGFAVLPTVFAMAPTTQYAHEALAAGNNGLTFVYLTGLFGEMPGGQILAGIFFLALAFAAVTTLISLMEVGVANLADAGISREKATTCIVIVGFILGLPSAFSVEFLSNQDWAWAVGLMLSGLFMSIAIMKYGVEKVRVEQINHAGADMYVGKWWSYCMRLVPVVFAGLIGWSAYQSVNWHPETWWHPFETFSIGTLIFQWGVTIAICYIFNNWLGIRFSNGQDLGISITGPGGKEAKSK